MAQGATLEGRLAVVVGGAGTVGRAVCRRLAEAGAAVAILDSDDEAAIRLSDALGRAGHRVMAVGVDPADREALETAFDAAEASFAPIGLLVLVTDTGAAAAVRSVPLREAAGRMAARGGGRTHLILTGDGAQAAEDIGAESDDLAARGVTLTVDRVDAVGEDAAAGAAESVLALLRGAPH